MEEIPKPPLVFFSSDSNPLYKADIYRCLALPSGHTIQFRYPPQLVHEPLRRDLSVLESRTGVIYFLAGNDFKLPESERPLLAYSVRQCTVVSADLEREADQITFILRLNEFVASKIDQNRTPRESLPLKTFVSEVVLSSSAEVTWLQAVKSIEAHFENSLFCQIACVLQGSQALETYYSKALRHSYFRLKEDSVYAIKCLCYDPKQQNRSLLIRYDTEDLEISNSFESGVGAGTDVRLLPLRTRALKAHSAQIFSIFYSPVSSLSGESTDPNYRDPNYFRIWWQIGRKWSKIVLFGVCSSLLALALAATQASDKVCPPWGTILLLFGVALAGCAAAGLFNFFNKV